MRKVLKHLFTAMSDLDYVVKNIISMRKLRILQSSTEIFKFYRGSSITRIVIKTKIKKKKKNQIKNKK